MIIEGKYLKFLLRFTTYIWLFIEIGAFIQTHSGWEYNELFWPFWLCLSLSIVMAVRLFDFFQNAE